MNPENIDDLFRRKLESHETPPDAALWARLAAGIPLENGALPTAGISVEPVAEAPVDAVFRAGLNGHASPVRRELWERLEDEHLRPRQRRAAAFWPLALAAVLALLVVAGGAGLWLRGRIVVGADSAAVAAGSGKAPAGAGQVGQRPASRAATAATGGAAAASAANLAAGTTAASTTVASTTTAPAAVAETKAGLSALENGPNSTALAAARPSRNAQKSAVISKKPAFDRISDKNQTAQATRPRQAASGASTGNGETGLAARPAPALAPEAPQPAVALAPTHQPDAASGNPASATTSPAPDLASSAGTIEVDVRPGGDLPRTGPAARATTGLANGPAAAETRRGSRAGRVLGGLLRQAGNLAQGQPLSLADAAGFGPGQTLTLEARLGRRTVSKSIQL